MDKKQIEAEIKAKKEAIKQANRELSKLQNELKKRDPLKITFISSYYDAISEWSGVREYRFSVLANRIITNDEIKRAIESLSDPVESKSYVDWDRIPKEYNWVAMDKNGSSFAYNLKPLLGDGYWDSKCTPWRYSCYLFAGDWRDSLIQRPGVKE